MLFTIAVAEAIGGQPLRIDIDLQRRNVGKVAEPHRGQLGIGIGHVEQPVARRDEFGAAHPAAVLELHRKSRRIAKTAHRAGNEGENLRVAQARQRLARPVGDRVGSVFLAGTVVPVDEVQKALAGILAGRTAPAAARDEEERADIGLFLAQQIFFDAVAHGERAFLRRARGQAELHRNAALILIGQKAGRQAHEHQHQQHQNDGVDAKKTAICGRRRGSRCRHSREPCGRTAC